MPKRPVPKNPRAEMSTVPKRPRQKIPELKCADKIRAKMSGAEKSRAEMSTVPKCPYAETCTSKNSRSEMG